MKYFVAYWCCDGFEYIEDITKYSPESWDLENAMSVLSGGKEKANTLNQRLNAMTLRARYNSQRDYELYGFKTHNYISESDIKEWADRDPQSLVNWIRENGVSMVTKAKKTKQRPVIV
jgi:hypothetical protein